MAWPTCISLKLTWKLTIIQRNISLSLKNTGNSEEISVVSRQKQRLLSTLPTLHNNVQTTLFIQQFKPSKPCGVGFMKMIFLLQTGKCFVRHSKQLFMMFSAPSIMNSKMVLFALFVVSFIAVVHWSSEINLFKTGEQTGDYRNSANSLAKTSAPKK